MQLDVRITRRTNEPGFHLEEKKRVTVKYNSYKYFNLPMPQFA